MTSIALNPTDTLHLVALDRPQLEAAHAKMIEWAKARRDKVDVDVDVESTNMDVAARNGWVTQPFARRLNALARQRTFYNKILAALEAGYAIVPNFGMNLFAIRTDAKAPRHQQREGRWGGFTEPSRMLPAGEGRYVNPVPGIVIEKEQGKDAKGNDVVKYEMWTADEFSDLEFPIALAQPELMSRVGQAMALKLFDEIGVAADQGSSIGGGNRGDPIFLGRLLNPRQGRPALTFFIGWYFDPSRL